MENSPNRKVFQVLTTKKMTVEPEKNNVVLLNFFHMPFLPIIANCTVLPLVFIVTTATCIQCSLLHYKMVYNLILNCFPDFHSRTAW